LDEPSAPQASWARRWLPRIVVGLVVSGALIAALLTQVDVARVGEVLTGMDARLLALGLAVYVVLGVIRAWRIHVLLPGAPMGSLYAIASVHQLLLRILPMRSGELGFAWLMRRSGEAGFAQSLVALMVLRVLDLTTVLVIWAVSLVAFDQMGAGSRQSVGAVVAVAIAGVAIAATVKPLLRVGHRVADGLIGALRLDRFARVARAQRSLAEAVGWSGTLPARVLWQATALTVVQWLVSFAFVFVIALAARLEVTPAQAVLGGVGTTVGSMLPVPGIGTFGGLEAGWAAGFALVGVPTEEAIASAFSFSVVSLGYSIVTAAAGWAILARRRN
jgi:uncharacterized membrane protein YbhN (UPF0104 family)